MWTTLSIIKIGVGSIGGHAGLSKPLSEMIGRVSAKRRRGPVLRRLGLEVLEPRTLLSVTVTGVPNWQELGPSAIFLKEPTVGYSTGAVNSIAVNPNNPANIVLGTANGGVWTTANANPNSPGQVSWETHTDDMPSLAIGAVAFSPLDPTGKTIFAGTGDFSSAGINGAAVGLYRTKDSGLTWTQLGQKDLMDFRIKQVLPTAVGADEAHQVILVAAWPGWTGNPPAVNGGGLFRSEDGGQTFKQDAVGLPAGRSVMQIIADPNVPTHFYATVPGYGVYYSSDGKGAVWVPRNNGIDVATLPDLLSKSGAIEITAHKAGGTVLYAGVAYPNGPTWPHGRAYVFRSTDGGANWQKLADTPSTFNAEFFYWNQLFNIVADPLLNNVVYISGHGWDQIYRYDPHGNNESGGWIRIYGDLDGFGNGAKDGTKPHGDHRDLVFLDSTTLLAADDGGLYVMEGPLRNTLATWQPFIGIAGGATGLPVAELLHIAHGWVYVDSLGWRPAVLGGTQDNGSISTVELPGSGWGDVWTQTLGGDGNVQAFDHDHFIRYVMGNSMGSFFRIRNVNGTDQMEQILLAFGLGKFSGLNADDKQAALQGWWEQTTPYVLNAVDPSRMLIGRTGLYESDSSSANTTGDFIKTVTPVDSNGTPLIQRATALAYGGWSTFVGDPLPQAVPNVAFVGDDQGHLLYRGEGNIFTPFTPVTLPFAEKINSIVLDPLNWRRVWVATSSHVLFADNIEANPTFVDITYNLGQLTAIDPASWPVADLRSLALFDPRPNPGDPIPIVGGRGGVYRLLGQTWTKYGQGLPDVVATEVQYVRTFANHDYLIAATLGRGAWMVENVSQTIHTIPTVHVVGNMAMAIDPNNPSKIVLQSDDDYATYQISTIQQIEALGLGRNDTMTVDFTNGNPVPIGGLSVAVLPGGNNRLVLRGGSFVNEVVTLDRAGTGTVAFNNGPFVPVPPPHPPLERPDKGLGDDPLLPGGREGASASSAPSTGLASTGVLSLYEDIPVLATITFTNLASIHDTVAVLNNTINVADGAEAVNIGDHSGLVDGFTATQVTGGSDSPFEMISFANKANVSIQGGDAGNLFNLNNPAKASGLASLTLRGGAASDTFSYMVGAANDNVVFDGGRGNDSVTNYNPRGYDVTLRDWNGEVLFHYGTESAEVTLKGTEQVTLLDPQGDIAFETTIDTPPDLIGTGIPGLEALEDAPQTVIDLREWFDDQPGGPAGLTYTLESIVPLSMPVCFASLVTASIDPRTGLVTLRYTPGTNGSALVTVRATDTSGQFVESTFTVTVNPLNSAPTFVMGPNLSNTDESGPQIIPGWATSIATGTCDELAQDVIGFTVIVPAAQQLLFSVLPTIDISGQLTYTPAPNKHGMAAIMVTLHDNGAATAGGRDTSDPQAFSITIEKPHRWHNTIHAMDVTGDNQVVAGDALDIINYLNAFGSGIVPTNAPFGPPYYDTTGDHFIAPDDALEVINYINAFGSGPGPTGEGESDSAREEPLAADTSASLDDLIALLAYDTILSSSQRRRRM